MVVKMDASDYMLATILSIYTPDGEIHPITSHLCSFHSTKLNYDTHDKELLAIFEAFKHWHQYIEGSAIPIDVVMDYKNLEYFAMTKLLTHRQVQWSEYLSQFNMVIHFYPRKLSVKPDALTRHCDVYHKGGNSNFATANLSNLHPIFTNEQLNALLWATFFAIPNPNPMICSNYGYWQLHNTIRESYPLNPVTAC